MLVSGWRRSALTSKRSSVFEQEPTLHDHLMASGFVSRAFMAQFLIETAKSHPDPKAWAKDFILGMTSRVDQNEITVDDRRYPVHELARHQIDALGIGVEQALSFNPR